jgi:hypothetical protein
MQKAGKVFKLVHPGAIKRKQILTKSMTSHNNTSLAFGIGINSKAQHMTAHSQDDQG